MLKIFAAAMVGSVLLAGTAFAADPAHMADTSKGKVWVDEKGMTLYVFDKDKKGTDKSACLGKCIVAWPPLLAAAGAKAEGEWTLVSVVDKDGKAAQMWAYDGKPLYHWMKDMKAGDATGDGVNGFHLAK
jgi:predicted lipoprotein with Yx(FWY)xxD motif